MSIVNLGKEHRIGMIITQIDLKMSHLTISLAKLHGQAFFLFAFPKAMVNVY